MPARADSHNPLTFSWNRVERAVPLIAAAVALAAGLYVIDTLPVGGFYDDAFYVILAKSLATGAGYRNLNLPGAPFATHYPPGYPLFLAAVWKIAPAFPANVLWFKAANALFLAAIAAVACIFARRQLGLAPGAAFVAVVAGTATTPALYLSSMVLSECMFLALLLPLLLWSERATATERTDCRVAMALGASAGALFLVRSQGVALVGAIVLAYVLRRRWKPALAAFAAAAVVAAPWLFWVHVHDPAIPLLMRGDYGSYFSWFADGLREHGFGLVTATLRRNAPAMFQFVVLRLRTNDSAIPLLLTWSSVAALALLGFFRLARRARVTFLFLLAYIATVAVWPFPPARFLLGIWVLLMLLLVAGVQAALDWRPPNADRWAHELWIGARVAVAVASLVVVVGAVNYNLRGYSRHYWRSTEEQSNHWIAPKLAWTRANTDTAAIIGSDHDEGSIYLYTGRRSVPVTTFTASEFLEPRAPRADSIVLLELAKRFGPRHLLLSSPRLRSAAAALGGTGSPLGGDIHDLVPWAYTIPTVAGRTADSLSLRASR